MKKLSLKNLNLGANDLLQRDQLKAVIGGYGGVDCFQQAINDLDSFEASLGFHLSQSHATEYLNDSYGVCWCMSYSYDPFVYDTCYN